MEKGAEALAAHCASGSRFFGAIGTALLKKKANQGPRNVDQGFLDDLILSVLLLTATVDINVDRFYLVSRARPVQLCARMPAMIHATHERRGCTRLSGVKPALRGYSFPP
jgi:hypothetical protein